MSTTNKGKNYKAIKTDECNEKYTEYDVYDGEEKIGSISKYGEEVLFSVWDKNSNLIGTRKNLKESVRMLANKGITPVIY